MLVSKSRLGYADGALGKFQVKFVPKSNPPLAILVPVLAPPKDGEPLKY